MFSVEVRLTSGWHLGGVLCRVFGDIERDKVNPEGLLYTTRKTIPYLKQIGVPQRAINTITVENPKRFFSRSSS